MLTPSSFAFRNEDSSILTIDSIGWQKIQSPAYRFAGDERPDCGHAIFQYTLSGQGYLEIENRRIPLPKGTGFLVKVPSSHHYYYEDRQEPWEILWLNVRGDEANRIWDLVIGQEDHVIRRDADSPLIVGLWELLRTISEGKQTDKYALSAQVYQWMLTLVQTSRELRNDMSAHTSTTVQKAKTYMKERYASPLTLEMLAEHCGINKHHLCRLFKKAERTSPLAYLRDRRMEAALRLLRTTELPVREVGARCGFDSPSYFGKIFREYMSVTPMEYRAKKLEFPYDAIYYE